MVSFDDAERQQDVDNAAFDPVRWKVRYLANACRADPDLRHHQGQLCCTVARVFRLYSDVRQPAAFAAGSTQSIVGPPARPDNRGRGRLPPPAGCGR